MQKQIRKSKIGLSRYKKEISENSKNSSSEEIIIDAKEEKELRCIDLRISFWPKKKTANNK